MKNIIVVTGGAGFVGSNLISFLLKKTSYQILSLDNYSSGSKKNHIKSNRVNYLNCHTKNISKKLNNKNSTQSIFFKKISNLLSVKRKQKAFHPNAARYNMSLGSKIFSFKRVSINKKQTIICISNLSSKIQRVNLNKIYHNWKNLIGPKIEIKNKLLIVKPFETIWLSNR